MHNLRFAACLAFGVCFLILCFPINIHAANGPGRVYIPVATNSRSSSIGLSDDLSTEEKEVIRLTNDMRSAAGCNPLTVNFKLLTAARNHSRDMADHNTMSHTGSDGSTIVERYSRVGYEWSLAAENVAAGYSTAADVMEGWANSSGHRKNILNCSITEIGVGYVYSEDDHSSYWTQDFGTPQ